VSTPLIGKQSSQSDSHAAADLVHLAPDEDDGRIHAADVVGDVAPFFDGDAVEADVGVAAFRGLPMIRSTSASVWPMCSLSDVLLIFERGVEGVAADVHRRGRRQDIPWRSIVDVTWRPFRAIIRPMDDFR
jgi:hypothetical protein